MTPFRSDFLKTLNARGFIHQGTDLEGLDQLLTQEIVTAYIGFDATADSLHVGHLLPIMMLYHLQQHGHQPIVLIGGGTTKIGDPTGKDASRQMLSEAAIAANITAIQKDFSQFLTFGTKPTDALMLNNAEWLDELNYLNFLRDYGPLFSVNRMLAVDSIKLRLEREQPMSFLEFNYMIFQSYDFVELNRRYKCRLQMGGSDQWGNIISGVDLGRRVNGQTLFGLTSPLLTTATGAKMGKTSAGAVWLNPEKLSPYEYWQYWRNTHDADVIRFMKLFTVMPLDEIAEYEKLTGEALNNAKRRLADEVTSFLHGAAVLPEIHTTVDTLFAAGPAVIQMDALESVALSSAEIATGVPLINVLQLTGIVTSNGEARRLIRGRGVKLNEVTIEDQNYSLSSVDFEKQNPALLSCGKKKHFAVKMIE